MSFHTLLVANRGEIALRVMQTAKGLGIRTVAVCSEADLAAPHVTFADDFVCIGPGPVGESYLCADKLLEAALATGADAIHPGYGFLSENAAFAQAVADAGIAFVGPPVNAIDVMGDKARAKRAMITAGVPCIPGYQGEAQDDDTLINAALEVGFPLMVKAAAGGGGRGMRLVHEASALADAISRARSEAQNAFGSGDLILERAILEPRHVEVQVFGDRHGNVIHLGERDCSVQRRHQKVIEEAPCPVMNDDLRAAMGRAAVEAAKAVDYVGAGTVEFLLADNGEFYFLEMNTRLQVEHPVTEEITGLDLVALQLQVAAGEPLGLEQSDVELNGHSIEVRLYAEDPSQDFMPSVGRIECFDVPDLPGVRLDTGVISGGEVSPFYDAMVAKLIAWGENRDIARKRLLSALKEMSFFGVANNRDFLIDALSQQEFVDGEATTGFIGRTYGEEGFPAVRPTAVQSACAAALLSWLRMLEAQRKAPWLNPELLGWASDGATRSVVVFEEACESKVEYHVGITGRTVSVSSGESTVEIVVRDIEGSQAFLTVAGRGCVLSFSRLNENSLALSDQLRTFAFVDLSSGQASVDDAKGGGHVVAPMHGVMVDVSVVVGESVCKGQTLAVLEAMKMQHEIVAAVDGVVESVNTAAGQQVAADDLLIVISNEEEAAA